MPFFVFFFFYFFVKIIDAAVVIGQIILKWESGTWKTALVTVLVFLESCRHCLEWSWLRSTGHH